MNRFEIKLLWGLSVLLFIGVNASDVSTIQKFLIIVGPWIIWTLVKRLFRMLCE